MKWWLIVFMHPSTVNDSLDVPTVSTIGMYNDGVACQTAGNALSADIAAHVNDYPKQGAGLKWKFECTPNATTKSEPAQTPQ
jgi:hypothetical protein